MRRSHKPQTLARRLESTDRAGAGSTGDRPAEASPQHRRRL